MKIGVMVESFRLGFRQGVERAAALGAQGIQAYATGGELAADIGKEVFIVAGGIGLVVYLVEEGIAALCQIQRSGKIAACEVQRSAVFHKVNGLSNTFFNVF